MIKQPRYRGVFMEMNPGKGAVGREVGDGEFGSHICIRDLLGERIS